MGLETTTYIDGLVATNPTGTDPKSQGDDHIRLLKSSIKATFPNIAGAVTPTHTELNCVDGVTSAIQTQLNARGLIDGQAWTGDHTFVTQSAGDNSTKAATTAYVDTGLALKAPLASPTFTGTPVAPTASPGANSTQIATTAYVDAAAFASALPNQSGNAGKFVTTDGSTASWTNILDLKAAKSSNYTVIATDRYSHFVLTSSATLTLTAAATLGDGFRFWVRNDGTSTWTIDPNSSETIDGSATLTVYPGESFAVIGDGSNWRTFGRQKRWETAGSASPNNSAAAYSFTSLAICDEIMVLVDGVAGSGTVTVEVGDTTPSYGSALTIGTGNPVTVSAAVVVGPARNAFGRVAIESTTGTVGASPAASSASASGGVWRVTGGVRSVRVACTSGNLNGGSITVLTR